MRPILLLATLALAAVPALAADPASADAPGRPALVVMDIQSAYLPLMDAREAEVGLYMINLLADLFHRQGLPVIRVHHTDPVHGPAPDSPGFAFPDTVRVTSDDPMVVKTHPSAFQDTDLEKILRDRDVDTVFLVGLSSVGCVLATYFDATRLGFTTFMVKDAVISHRPDLTSAVEDLTDAVGYDAVTYMVRPTTH